MVSSEVYATVDEFKERNDTKSSTQDSLITALLSAASRAVDNYCNRFRFGFLASDTATALEFPGTGRRYIYIYECVEITQVERKDSVSDTTYPAPLAASAWRGFAGSPKSPNAINYAAPFSGVMLTEQAGNRYFVDGRTTGRPGFYDDDPYQRDPYLEPTYEPTVRVTARWGHADAVPDVIREATIGQAMILYKRFQGGMADVLTNNAMGEARYVRKVDPMIAMLLDHSGYVRSTLAGRS